MTDVVFFLPAINPYWRDRFNALAEAGNVHFHCVFSSYIDPERSWTVTPESMDFPHTFLTTSSRSPRRAAELVFLWRKLRPARVFTFHHMPVLWPAWFHRLAGGHLALYALMTWDSWVKRTWRKELLKRLFFSFASSTLTPGPDSDSYLKRYGAAHSHRLHHAVEWQAFAEAMDTRAGSDDLRLLYIGRLIPEKGIPFLLDVLDRVLRTRNDVCVEIVGDGRLYTQVEQWAREREGRVTVSPFIQAADIAEVYARNDILLFPTLGDPYGLVVDEALASGVPVISTDRAGDIRWRLGQSRGRVLPPDALEEWVAAIVAYAEDRELVERESAAAVSFSRGHGTERWVRELHQWVRLTASERARGRSRSRA
ncbi:glycosyltransferase family 4 protein [Microbacterium enclense]|uniref:glycosyltransferase family 4 protein n=1 Tax=Microbacterium enclense TaxID=993073 RepID=UPI00203A93C0|nr:glycosyltransferase family 4 protein [Microbacterium enclense]MCM3614323.1 glycosyltransferase family 4 protein [Microbacterium enclense]